MKREADEEIELLISVKCKKKYVLEKCAFLTKTIEAENFSGCIKLEGFGMNNIEEVFVNGTRLRSTKDITSLLCTSYATLTDLNKKFIQRMEDDLNIVNCLRIRLIADSFNLRRLATKAKKIALANFNFVKDSSEFLRLELDQMTAYLSDESLKATREIDVFHAAVEWYLKNGLEDQQSLLKLLKCIDYSKLSESDLRSMISHPKLFHNLDIHKIFFYIMSNRLDDIVHVNPEHASYNEVAKDCIASVRRLK